MKQTRSNIKTVKITKKIGFILEITITPLKNKSNVWHIFVKIPKKENEETICPKDIFGYTVENYEALLNFFRALQHATKNLRKEMRRRAHNQPLQNSQVTETQIKNKHQRQEQKNIQRNRMQNVSFITQATKSMKENLSTKNMIEQVALALALTGTSVKEIENEIKQHGKYFIDIPITSYPDLSVMQQQHSSSWLSIVESALSIGSNVQVEEK